MDYTIPTSNNNALENEKSFIVSFPTKLNLSFFVPRVESYTFMVLLNAVKLLRTP